MGLDIITGPYYGGKAPTWSKCGAHHLTSSFFPFQSPQNITQVGSNVGYRTRIWSAHITKVERRYKRAAASSAVKSVKRETEAKLWVPRKVWLKFCCLLALQRNNIGQTRHWERHLKFDHFRCRISSSIRWTNRLTKLWQVSMQQTLSGRKRERERELS